MRVTMALLADAANVSREGKLNVLGVFDTIYARAFPVAHAQMQLVLRFDADGAEAGTTSRFEVQLVAPDGAVLARVPVAMTPPRPETGERVRIDHILTFANIGFERAGRYTIRVVLGDGTETTVPLRLEQLPTSH
jgi:uncharacterized protein DUF6941